MARQQLLGQTKHVPLQAKKILHRVVVLKTIEPPHRRAGGNPHRPWTGAAIDFSVPTRVTRSSSLSSGSPGGGMSEPSTALRSLWINFGCARS